MGTKKMEVSEVFKSIAEKSRHGEFKSCRTAETIETQWNQHWKITDGKCLLAS